MADKLFYMSFSEPKPPNGRGWLGAAYIEAKHFKAALTKSRELGINPGGEVMACEIPRAQAKIVPQADRHRLLTLDDLRRIDPHGRAVNQRGEEV